MRSLFFKIFLCFWLSHLIAFALVYAFMNATDAQRRDPQRGGRLSIPPSRSISMHARSAVGAFENAVTQKSAVLQNHLDKLRDENDLRGALFTPDGTLLAGRETTPEASRLAGRAARSDEIEFMPSPRGMLAAKRVDGAQGSAYIFVAEMPRREGPPRGEPGGPGGLRRRQFYEVARSVAVLLAAGIVAYALSLYLTAPTTKLRQASRQLAGGDLSTRVGAKMGKRRDELADLGHDFDRMAERIESLMTNERRLLGDISHELRSPLARLQVALDLAYQSADPETRNFLERIERESGRLNALIGQLLTLTRLENAGAETLRKSVDLEQLINEITADADFEARGNNRWVRVVEAEHCQTTGNSDLLRSAIENVVRNAVRYTNENTAVEISLRTTPQSGLLSTQEKESLRNGAVITVRDYGPGVPEESLSELFRPFYRVADARDRQSGGVGLGLSITARAVRFHGGEVTAKNAPGGGLLIEMRLPIGALS